MRSPQKLIDELIVESKDAVYAGLIVVIDIPGSKEEAIATIYSDNPNPLERLTEVLAVGGLPVAIIRLLKKGPDSFQIAVRELVELRNEPNIEALLMTFIEDTKQRAVQEFGSENVQFD